MQRSDTHALKNLQITKNPVQIAREELGYTQDLLSAVAGVAPVLIKHTEFGLLKNIPTKIRGVLSDSGLDQKYSWWITDTRQKNYRYLERGVVEFLQPGCSGYGNWLEFRTKISTSKIGFCKLYCVHPQVLATFENNWEERFGFTKGMRDILLSAGVAGDVIQRMEFAMLRRGGQNG